MEDKIKDLLASDLFVSDYQKYAIGVNLDRAVPDVRDGLKPVQRNILYSMKSDSTGYSHNVKCARIVGDTMGKYHPHGDSSIYGSLVNMANWYSTKMPLIQPEGNFGTIQGDSEASMRYTEATLSKFTKECVLSDIKSSPGITDYVPNFDNTTTQPEYLPVKVPLLLINGTNGIGVGKSSFIPSHNLSEVIDATINYIKNPDKPVVLIPDECKGSDIIEANWTEICNTGHGSYRVRSIIDIGKNEKNNPMLIIRTTPDSVSFNKIESKITELAKTILPQIVAIGDDTKNSEGTMYITIDLKKGSDPYYVREMLYKKTQLEVTNTVNFNANYGIRPLRLSYKSYLELFVNTSFKRIFRYYTDKLSTVQSALHERELYIKVIESGHIDEFINNIRQKKDTDDKAFIEWMIKTLNVTDGQAEFLYNISLKKLSDGYFMQYKKEVPILQAQSEEYINILTNDDVIKEMIIKELKDIKKKYGQPRKSKVIKKPDDCSIPEGKFTIVITENNFIKKIENGQNIGVKDSPKFLNNSVDNKDNLLIFNSKGRVFKLPVHKVPLMDKSNSGIDMRVIIKNLSSDIVSVVQESIVKDFAKLINRPSMVVLTEQNHIKKLDLNDICTVPNSGIIYAKLSPGENVKDVKIISENEDVIVYSDRKALRYPMSTIPLYGRMSNGVSAMGGDVNKLDGLSVIFDESNFIVVITEKGKINKFPSQGLQSSDRRKAGNSVIKLGSGDKILSIHSVLESDTISLLTSNGDVNIPVAEIPVTSSISSGTKMISGKGIIFKSKVL